MSNVLSLDREAIQKYLPHTDLALGIDSALYDPANPEQITATKTLCENDPYFIGHFPNNPVLPGHWQLELICLTAALLCRILLPETLGYPTLTRFYDMEFKRVVKPGDTINITSTFIGHNTFAGNTQFLLSGNISRGKKIVSLVKEIRGVLKNS